MYLFSDTKWIVSYCWNGYVHTKYCYICNIVSSFSHLLQAEANNDKEKTEVSTENTHTSVKKNRVSSALPAACELCSDTSKKMSSERNYFGKIRPLVCNLCISDTNMNITCTTEIVGEEERTEFSSTTNEDEKKHWKELIANELYEANCVQILDAIPLDSDDLEESEIEYYDSLINM